MENEIELNDDKDLMAAVAQIESQLRALEIAGDESSETVSWPSGEGVFPMDAGGVDFTQFSFGCSVNGATVTVQAGKVRHGTHEPIEVASADVTITVDQTWIWIEYEYGSGVATIESGTTEPQDDVATHKHALSLWGFADDVATLEHTYHVGDIFIPGVFA